MHLPTRQPKPRRAHVSCSGKKSARKARPAPPAKGPGSRARARTEASSVPRAAGGWRGAREGACSWRPLRFTPPSQAPRHRYLQRTHVTVPKNRARAPPAACRPQTLGRPAPLPAKSARNGAEKPCAPVPGCLGLKRRWPGFSGALAAVQWARRGFGCRVGRCIENAIPNSCDSRHRQSRS